MQEVFHFLGLNARGIKFSMQMMDTSTHWRQRWAPTGDRSLVGLTGKHLVDRGGDVSFSQLLIAGGVVKADLGAALQRDPHAGPRAHHAGDAAPAVLSHLKRVLRVTEAQ